MRVEVPLSPSKFRVRELLFSTPLDGETVKLRAIVLFLGVGVNVGVFVGALVGVTRLVGVIVGVIVAVAVAV
jgi:hypothetical protein